MLVRFKPSVKPEIGETLRPLLNIIKQSLFLFFSHRVVAKRQPHGEKENQNELFEVSYGCLIYTIYVRFLSNSTPSNMTNIFCAKGVVHFAFLIRVHYITLFTNMKCKKDIFSCKKRYKCVFLYEKIDRVLICTNLQQKVNLKHQM